MNDQQYAFGALVVYHESVWDSEEGWQHAWVVEGVDSLSAAVETLANSRHDLWLNSVNLFVFTSAQQTEALVYSTEARDEASFEYMRALLDKAQSTRLRRSFEFLARQKREEEERARRAAQEGERNERELYERLKAKFEPTEAT